MNPTQQTQDEADRVDLVYQYVLATLGAKTTTEVLALWQRIPAGQAAQTASSWLRRAVNAILTRRTQARDLGLAYYRLARALRTGSTIAHPLKEEVEPEFVSLEMLRQEFEALVAEHTGEGSTDITADTEPIDDDDAIAVENVSGLSDALEADESSSEQYAEALLEEMAETASNKVSAIPDDTPLADARETTRALHLQHGAMVAGAASKTAMNGGRNATNQASARDPRVIGWVRQHGKSDKPCYFCAMHISRRVLYKSARTAGQGRTESNAGNAFLGDGLFKFHDNCHCTAEAVYSDEGFSTNPKYAQNRYYAQLWDDNIKGKFSGPDAINEWRKLLKRIYANQSRTAAQEAA
jgi:hypothetical protein